MWRAKALWRGRKSLVLLPVAIFITAFGTCKCSAIEIELTFTGAAFSITSITLAIHHASSNEEENPQLATILNLVSVVLSALTNAIATGMIAIQA